MQIEISEVVQSALERAAAAAGMSPSGYAMLLLEEQLLHASETASKRIEAVDALIEHMRTATTSSGRNGCTWRDFIHEGHGSLPLATLNANLATAAEQAGVELLRNTA